MFILRKIHVKGTTEIIVGYWELKVCLKVNRIRFCLNFCDRVEVTIIVCTCVVYIPLWSDRGNQPETYALLMRKQLSCCRVTSTRSRKVIQETMNCEVK